MKTGPAKTVLTFGGLIASFYKLYGERNAQGILRLVVKANLVTFRAPNRYAASRATRNA